MQKHGLRLLHFPILVHVPLLEAPTLTAKVADIPCFGAANGSISVGISGGTPGIGFAWSNGETTPDIQNLALGTYMLDLTFADGACAQTLDFQLTELLPLLSAGVNTVAACENEANGSLVFLGAAQGVPPYGLLWSPDALAWVPGLLKQKLKPEETTQYEVQVTDVFGCTATAALLVQVVNYGVYAPNAIMPGSVENGAFTLYAGPGIERIKLLRVFERWGSLVFEKRGFAPNDPSAGWNGSLGAQPFSPGVFVWYAELEGVDGRVLIFNGDVTVTR